jgi:hypothetical protein
MAPSTTTNKIAEPFGKHDFMRLGLEVAREYKWIKHKHHVNVQDYRTYYGVTPRVTARVWHLLRVSNNPQMRLFHQAKPMHLLLAIRFCWRYEVEKELGKHFNIKSPKTVRKWVKYFLSRLRLLLGTVIPKWSDVYKGLRIFFTVDGTHCLIEEPKPWSSMWSSHKFGGSAGVNYELGLAIDTQTLLWVYGPVPAGAQNDISIFKDYFQDAIDDFALKHGTSFKGLGDKGYRGAPDYISTRNDLDPAEISEFKNRSLARHETFNQKLKMFASLDTRFRHGVDFHAAVFESVCVLVILLLNSDGLSLFDSYPDCS